VCGESSATRSNFRTVSVDPALFLSLVTPFPGAVLLHRRTLGPQHQQPRDVLSYTLFALLKHPLRSDPVFLGRPVFVGRGLTPCSRVMDLRCPALGIVVVAVAEVCKPPQLTWNHTELSQDTHSVGRRYFPSWPDTVLSRLSAGVAVKIHTAPLHSGKQHAGG
jgi:hypothetical protein